MPLERHTSAGLKPRIRWNPLPDSLSTKDTKTPINGVQGGGGDGFLLCRGDGHETGYRACLWLRSAIRVLVLLAEDSIDKRQWAGDWLYDWMRYTIPTE